MLELRTFSSKPRFDKLDEAVVAAAHNSGYKYRSFHGTTAEFNEFKADKVGRTKYPDTIVGEAYFFGDSKLTCATVADTRADGSFDGGVIRFLDCFLKIDNPMIWNPTSWGEEDVIKTEVMAALIQQGKERGRDGVIWKSKVMGDVYVVFKPNQVKLAVNHTYDDKGKEIPLSLRFDVSKSDMRW